MRDKQQMLRSYEQREQLRHQYQREQLKEVSIKANKRDIYGKEDMLNLPRHQVYTSCADFVECAFDYKCRSYNPTYVKCQNCVLNETDGICKKEHIHTERAMSRMISRERIDLDDN